MQRFGTWGWSLLLLLITASAQAESFRQAPKAMSAIRQGAAIERSNPRQAIAYYCNAARLGNPEAYFRIGRLLARGPQGIRSARQANAYLAMAMRLGNQQAARYYNTRVGNAPLGNCGVGSGPAGVPWVQPATPFDQDKYLARQSASKQKLANMVRQAAERHQVDPKLALAIAIAESNLDRFAVSPKQAQGVMQLIPATQQRFGVTRPFDAEQNIRGAMVYLKWLEKQFGPDWIRISAAYNAGEKAVARYGGIPPYQETQDYVQRVLYYSGHQQTAETKPSLR
ncbi:lytic transglycosylase domain-containing protein [Aeromonas enteropelogenes]|uniref:lytic transglycosylase domain-containing protein n=1 Tax=Aeromonas enteropelogenes TaxID=29489 RepID=UPI001CCE7EDA|nr:lytic transglycosylase domain-containing protein [Aeromonas enteropelogenes]UBH27412.1 lytic transglycosylase domain-containing protein [Aeromonas enteropelogenes]